MKPVATTSHSFANRLFVLIALVASLSAAPALCVAAETSLPAAIQHYNLGPEKVALKGYDPVGYFTKNQALKGRRELGAQHQGVTYYFASEQNKKLFADSPGKYLPAYGGWCATAMAKGEKVDIDPNNFKLSNGRLFLFYKGLFGNALKDWEKDEATLTAKADANWSKITGE